MALRGFWAEKPNRVGKKRPKKKTNLETPAKKKNQKAVKATRNQNIYGKGTTGENL